MQSEETGRRKYVKGAQVEGKDKRFEMHHERQISEGQEVLRAS